MTSRSELRFVPPTLLHIAGFLRVAGLAGNREAVEHETALGEHLASLPENRESSKTAKRVAWDIVVECRSFVAREDGHVGSNLGPLCRRVEEALDAHVKVYRDAIDRLKHLELNDPEYNYAMDALMELTEED